MEEQPLRGGFVTSVVRSGATVRRSPPGEHAYARELLRWLEERGWGGAPRFLGTDERGREVLSFIDGHVPLGPARPPWVASEEGLARLAELIRQFHDLTAGTPLARGAEVACHNDLSVANTVYSDSGTGPLPVAFIDWDLAATGRRVHDIAHACWQYLGLGPGVDDPAEAGRRMRLICDSYCLSDRDSLLETILWWQDRCWRGIEAQAAAGDPVMTRLRDSGAPQSVRDAFDWVGSHRAELATHLA